MSIAPTAWFGASALALMPAFASAQVPPPGPPPPPVIVTIGQATVRLPPDRAFLVVSTEVRALKPGEAQQRNAAAMTRVQQKLQAAGLQKDTIRTVTYSLNEDFEYADN